MKKILLFLLLAACGFRPMYSDSRIDIFVLPISGTSGIDLRNSLNAMFGGNINPDAPYKLKVTLNDAQKINKALESTGNATWQEIKVEATYVLLYNDKEIYSGTESASESYTFVNYLVASTASYNNAVSNTIQILSHNIGTKVLVEQQKHNDEMENN
ncbi:MAG: hypothetical protein MJ158_02735 [Alphaproteobacteria bacterium]|nr:hypothetical protein [Alphaproteobacteria bacterium]